jgi:outer membrane protein assembly factor BamD (BamD/ComL family)
MNLRNKIKVILSAISLIFLCMGCLLNDLNVGHYETYYESGLSHLRAENYSAAKKSFVATIYYAQAGFLGPAANAAA